MASLIIILSRMARGVDRRRQSVALGSFRFVKRFGLPEKCRGLRMEGLGCDAPGSFREIARPLFSRRGRGPASVLGSFVNMGFAQRCVHIDLRRVNQRRPLGFVLRRRVDWGLWSVRIAKDAKLAWAMMQTIGLIGDGNRWLSKKWGKFC